MALSRSRKIAVFSIITLCFSLAVTNATDITKTIRQPGMATTIVFLPQQPIATAKSYNHDPYLQIISPTTSKEVVAKVTLENETTITQYVSVQPTFQRLGLTQAGDTLSKKLSPGISSEFVFPLDTLPRRKGPSSITIKVTSTPSIDELPGNAVDQGFGNIYELSYNTHVLFFPRKLVGLLASLFLLALLRPRKKGVHTPGNKENSKKHHTQTERKKTSKSHKK